MNLGLLTAIWGRPRLTEMVLGYYEELPLDKMSFVYSPEDPEGIVRDWDYYAHSSRWLFNASSNSNLSGKWNKGLDNPRDGGWNAVMIVGSDDLVTPRYIEAVKYLLEKGADYIYLPALYIYNLQDGRMHYCLAERLGLGRVLSRRLLDRLDWKPWPDGINRGLDGEMWKKINALKDVNIVRLGVDACHRLGIAAMDIKGSGNNLWGYDETVMSLLGSEVKDPSKVLYKHFPSVANELLTWNTSNTRHGTNREREIDPRRAVEAD